MTTINLTNGYFIEVDDLNHTLKQRYKGKKKDGEERDGIRTHGYYGNLNHALTAFVKLNQIDCMADTAVTMGEYVRRIEEINNEAVKGLERALGGRK